MIKKLFLFTAALITIVGGWFLVNKFILRSRASEEILQIYPEKQELNAVVGEPFTTKVMLQGPAGKRVSAAKIEMYYDKTKLVFLGTEETDTSCTTLEHQIQITDDTASSKVVWSKVSFKKKDDLPQGLICFGVLRFKPIAAGAVVIAPVISTTIEAVGPSDTFAIRTNEKSNLAVTITDATPSNSMCIPHKEVFAGNKFNETIFSKAGTLNANADSLTIQNGETQLQRGSGPLTANNDFSIGLTTKQKLPTTEYTFETELKNLSHETGKAAQAYIDEMYWISATDYQVLRLSWIFQRDNTMRIQFESDKKGKDLQVKNLPIPITPTSVLSSVKLKLARSGSKISGYADIGTGYQLLDTFTIYDARPQQGTLALWADSPTKASVTVKSIQFTCGENMKPPVLYKLNEGTGAVVSNSVDNTYAGTFSGTGVHWVSGKNGMAGNFEGDDDFVVTPDADLFSSPQFTISGWYKWDGKRYATSTNKDSAALFSKGVSTTTTDEYALLLHRLDTSVDTNMSFYLNGAKVVEYPNSNLDIAWHYVSVSYDGTTAKLFIDAHKVAEKAATVVLNNSTSPFTIGAQNNGTLPFGGIVDNVSYYPYARTEAQLSDDMKVENEYVVPTPAPTTTLTGVAGSRLDLKLHFMGVPDKPAKNQTSVTVTLTKKDGTEPKKFENILLTAATSNDWTGFVTLTDVAPGEYYVLVKGPKHLQRKFCHLVPEPGTTGGDTCPAGTAGIVLGSGTVLLDAAKVPLAPGDLAPQDATFNANDISKFQKHIFKNDSGALDLADVNYDGVVNGNDFAILLQSMAKNFTDEL